MEPIQRYKSGWLQEHEKLMMESRQSTAEVVLIGDSIVGRFQRYPKILNRCFKPNNILNLGNETLKETDILQNFDSPAL